MQHHLMKPMFLCPVPNCDFSSNYDKAHVHAHIRRMHQGMQEEAKVVDKKVYQAEEDVWMERCFGVRISREATQEEKENQPSPVKKEEVPERYGTGGTLYRQTVSVRTASIIPFRSTLF